MTDRRQDYNVKPLCEINRSFNEKLVEKREAEGQTVKDNTAKRGCVIFCILSDVLFYLAIAVIFYTFLFADNSDGRTRSVMGYSCFTVMSSSMQGEIPKGSLIVTRYCEASALRIGDNITYFRDNGTTITHKIVEIFEPNACNQIRFRTRGVNNSSPDDYTVAQSDVLGKVILVIPKLGTFINRAGENVHIMLIFFLICSLLSFLLKGIFTRKEV